MIEWSPSTQRFNIRKYAQQNPTNICVIKNDPISYMHNSYCNCESSHRFYLDFFLITMYFNDYGYNMLPQSKIVILIFPY